MYSVHIQENWSIHIPAVELTECVGMHLKGFIHTQTHAYKSGSAYTESMVWMNGIYDERKQIGKDEKQKQKQKQKKTEIPNADKTMEQKHKRPTKWKWW